ncbi:Inositol-tetrakisphosphate 1-kinase 1 [Forsythia ovata]|uniref:Inositol-tetrakisphosphate 1-kinase 1 n=1 Tax=Forsythia ovata TaxID=205694 RepID=A0ABD1XA95_9LAMI
MAEENVMRYRIGYALEQKKVQTIIQSSLIIHARNRGIDLISIDLGKPLIDQGPFHCIIHKLSGPKWSKQLQEFSSRNPDVIVVDPLDSVERIHNRISMLQVVNEVKICQKSEISFGIPKQIFVENPASFYNCIETEGLKFPVIAKSLVANGSAKSHQMFLVFNKEGLEGLKPPIILQEFVNHGGVIFKVYVAGEHVKCVKRKSLPDISSETIGTSQNLLSFSQISNLTSEDQSDESVDRLIEEAEMPPMSFVTEIANGLKQAFEITPI